MLVFLLLWCCGGSCWGACYCLLQSMFTLFGVFESGSLCCVSHSRRRRKTRSWRKRAHKMRRRRKLAYHLVLKCRHRNGLRALDGTKLLVPAYSKHKQWKERMLALDRVTANATNISSNPTPKSPTQYYTTGALVIATSLSCHISYVHSRAPSNSMNGRINAQLSQW